jgi:hypothetical protein
MAYGQRRKEYKIGNEMLEKPAKTVLKYCYAINSAGWINGLVEFDVLGQQTQVQTDSDHSETGLRPQ